MDESPIDRVDRVGYDPATETYRAFHDPDDPESMCVTIVSAVAAVTGESPMEMEPFYEAIVPELLDALLNVTELEDSALSLRYEGVDVTVYSSGDVVLDASDLDAVE